MKNKRSFYLVALIFCWSFGPILYLFFEISGGEILDGLWGVYRNSVAQNTLISASLYFTPIGFVTGIFLAEIMARKKFIRRGNSFLIWLTVATCTFLTLYYGN